MRASADADSAGTLRVLGIKDILEPSEYYGLMICPLLLAAVLLGVVNAVVRPVLVFLTLPITILTLGLFLLVINALMLWLAATIVPGFIDTHSHADDHILEHRDALAFKQVADDAIYRIDAATGARWEARLSHTIFPDCGLSGDEILYVGDHMFGDVRVTKVVIRWRTALVLRELEAEPTGEP